MGRKAMDPDRFQMKDIKRRLNGAETRIQRQSETLQKFRLRIIELEAHHRKE